MIIRVNGEDRETESKTIRDLVQELGLPEKALLIEQNGTALRPADWPASRLSDSDRIEFIRIVAGG